MMRPKTTGLKRMLPAILLITLAGCQRSAFNDRKAYWEKLLASAVPAGTPKAAIEDWGKSQSIHFDYIKQRQMLYANAERVTEHGLTRFICSQWNVIIQIQLDSDAKAIKREVSGVGSCL